MSKVRVVVLAFSSDLGRHDQEDSEEKAECIELETLDSKKISIIASGGRHNVALNSAGELYSWGRGKEGQLGTGDLVENASPARVATLKKKKLISVVCGSNCCLALTKSEVFFWGLDEIKNEIAAEPIQLGFFAKKKVIAISAGHNHCAAIVKNSDESMLYTWGCGDKGQLGNRASKSSADPVEVSELRGARVQDVFCGSEFTVVMTERGNVYTFGHGESGKLGIGSQDDVSYPVVVSQFNQSEAKQIAAGLYHVMVVTRDGQVFTWGYGPNGRLGHGDEEDCVTPKLIKALDSHWIDRVFCGGHHSMVLTDKGELFSFGWNHYGQLGHPRSEESVLTPKLVDILASHKVLTAAGGEQQTVVLVDKSKKK